ncbi:MAG: GIY-YIG nuclease family protein [Nitrosomonas ureae]
MNPEEHEGYVYYIRLKTNKGRFYKIGFTRMSSVEQRFSYEGSEAYKMIDKVLLFKYSFHAYDIEQHLHGHLRHVQAYKKYGFSSLFQNLSEHPLYKDGQSELYEEDILGLDPEYTRPFQISSLFSKPKNDLIKRRMLQTDFYHKSVRDEEVANLYNVFDEFLTQPAFESKEEFINRIGSWVYSIRRWAIRNTFFAGPFCVSGKTIHDATPLPTTKEELLEMTEFAPVWGYTDSIPEEIKYLKNLRYVKFEFESIKTLPQGLFELKNIVELDINGTSIKSISRDIEKLSNLEILNIQYCDKLFSLPPEIEKLDKLRKIIISKNHFNRLKVNIPNKAHLLDWGG